MHRKVYEARTCERRLSYIPIINSHWAVNNEDVTKSCQILFNRVTDVKSWLLSDRFAIGSTTSTTAVIISMLLHTSILLRNNNNIALISLDFTKAFDMVIQLTLTANHSPIDLLYNVYNWQVEFLGNYPNRFWWSVIIRRQYQIPSANNVNVSVLQGILKISLINTPMLCICSWVVLLCGTSSQS